MSNHNQFQKISRTPQPNSVVYSDENGAISSWLSNDPLIESLKQQTEFIGTVPTIPEGEDLQEILSQFVLSTTGRDVRNGDEVAIEDVGELWLYNGTEWIFFTNTTLKDATKTSKGVVQIGEGIDVTNGVISVDTSSIEVSRETITVTGATPSVAAVANKDYVFPTNLTSLTLTSVPNSSNYTTLTFVPANGFVFNANALTQYFFYNTPTFITGRTYRLTIVSGRCYVDYTGVRENEGVKKLVKHILRSSPELGFDPITGNAIIEIENTLNTEDAIVQVYGWDSEKVLGVDIQVNGSYIYVYFNSDASDLFDGDGIKVVIIG